MFKQLTTDAIALWRAHGGPISEVVVQPSIASGNNRIFTLVGPDGQKVIAKCYFRESARGTTRLAAEWSFLSFAAEIQKGSVPTPIARSDGDLVALYEFIDGRKMAAAEISEHNVLAAATFVSVLNKHKASERARALPRAAEAGFSIADHFSVVDRRVERLAQIQPNLSVDFDAAKFAVALSRRWTEVRRRVMLAADKHGFDMDRPISEAERIVSPSDFGFHNVLLRPDGSLVFIDFEYSGWDDSAKLVADFFFQPAIPVSGTYYDIFLHRLTEGVADATRIQARCQLLRPIFGIKWCCIMLNRFLPDMAARSRFADPEHDEAERKAVQLAKAVCAFDNLDKVPWLT